MKNNIFQKFSPHEVNDFILLKKHVFAYQMWSDGDSPG